MVHKKQMMAEAEAEVEVEVEVEVEGVVVEEVVGVEAQRSPHTEGVKCQPSAQT